MYKSILVPVDGSEHSLQALRVALTLATGDQATVHVLHVPPWPQANDVIGAAAGAPSMDISQDEILEAGRALLEKMLSELPDDQRERAVPLVALGNPADTILEAARNQRVDAIVMGSRGLGNLANMIMGSVSHKIMHAAECPTIIVRA